MNFFEEFEEYHDFDSVVIENIKKAQDMHRNNQVYQFTGANNMDKLLTSWSVEGEFDTMFGPLMSLYRCKSKLLVEFIKTGSYTNNLNKLSKWELVYCVIDTHINDNYDNEEYSNGYESVLVKDMFEEFEESYHFEDDFNEEPEDLAKKLTRTTSLTISVY